MGSCVDLTQLADRYVRVTVKGISVSRYDWNLDGEFGWELGASDCATETLGEFRYVEWKSVAEAA